VSKALIGSLLLIVLGAGTMLASSFKAPPLVPFKDSGSDHVFCCDSWRGCWAYHDDWGWVKFREHDCVSWPWQLSPHSLWRCHSCPKPHLPRIGTRHPRQVPNPNPKQ
jgi:hypothetical protein